MSYLLIFVLVVVAIIVLSRAAPVLGLIAHPGDHRAHEIPTPLVGGLGIFLGLVAGTVWMHPSLLSLAWPVSILLLVGVIDDRFKLPSWTRFALQAVVLWIMIKLTGVSLTTLGEIIDGREAVLHVWSVPLTVFAGIGVINAINMSDGMDGLAGVLSLLCLAGLYTFGVIDDSLIPLLAVCVLAFLTHNLRVGRPRASAFLGDAGSTLLGFLLAYLLIKHSQGSEAYFAPVSALWLLALPLFDAVSVLLLRPLRGSSPFAADRIHYHHVLLRRGMDVNRALLLIAMAQAALILLGLCLARYAVPESFQLMVFLVLFAAYLVMIWRANKKKAPQESAEP